MAEQLQSTESVKEFLLSKLKVVIARCLDSDLIMHVVPGHRGGFVKFIRWLAASNRANYI